MNRKQVAITADGEFVFTGWWINNERVQLYRRGETNSVEWRADIQGTEWFLPWRATVRDGAWSAPPGATTRSCSLFSTSGTKPPRNRSTRCNPPPDHLWVDAETCDDGRFFFGLAQGPSPGFIGRVVCYDRESGALLWWHEMNAQALGLDCSADGMRLAAASRWETVVLDTATGLPLDLVTHPGGAQALPALSGDGTLLAVGTTDGRLALYGWDGSSYLERWQYSFPVLDDQSFVSCVDISDDGSTVAAGTLDFLTDNIYGGKLHGLQRFGAAAPVQQYRFR